MSTPAEQNVGLCARCRHARQVATPRSLFWLCERSRTDTSYARYPRLPMLDCPGFEAGTPVGPLPGEGGQQKK
jgi:hypothetical protein